MARKQRRAAEINSSSMADIAFLLLIFFLVTTTIATDKGLTLTLPQKPDPNQKPPDVTKNQRNMFTILVNSQDRLLVEEKEVKDVKRLRKKVKEFVLNFGKPDTEYAQLYNGLPQKLKAQVKRRPDSSDDPKEAVVSFKADRGTSYKMYLAVLDELQGAYYEIYGERVGLTAEEFRNLNTKNPKEKQLYEQAKKGIPMNISIAEPTKTGGGE